MHVPVFGKVKGKVDNRWIITAVCTDKGWRYRVVDTWRTIGLSIKDIQIWR